MVVKVLDLAIARLEQLELAPTQHDVVAGVPAYMAFEQLVRDARRSVTRIEETIEELGRNPQRILTGGEGSVRQYDGRARR